MAYCKVCRKFGGWFEEEFVRKYDICEECFIESKGLVKDDNHYVPWIYRYVTHIPEYGKENYLEIQPEHYPDKNAVLPKISWCSEVRKWKTEFKAGIQTAVPSASGNNLEFEVLDSVWYFDTKKDIIDGMERTPYNKLIMKDNHYILQESRDAEDVNEPLPKISLCPIHNKWKIEFIGTDKNGDGNSDMVWYFDSKEAILKSMEKE